MLRGIFLRLFRRKRTSQRHRVLESVRLGNFLHRFAVPYSQEDGIEVVVALIKLLQSVIRNPSESPQPVVQLVPQELVKFRKRNIQLLGVRNEIAQTPTCVPAVE